MAKNPGCNSNVQIKIFEKCREWPSKNTSAPRGGKQLHVEREHWIHREWFSQEGCLVHSAPQKSVGGCWWWSRCFNLQLQPPNGGNTYLTHLFFSTPIILLWHAFDQLCKYGSNQSSFKHSSSCYYGAANCWRGAGPAWLGSCHYLKRREAYVAFM